jgi:hypothetical protein
MEIDLKGIIFDLKQNGKTLLEIKKFLKEKYGINLALVEIDNILSSDNEVENNLKKQEEKQGNIDFSSLKLKAKPKKGIGLKSLKKTLEKVLDYIENGKIDRAYVEIYSLYLTVENKLLSEKSKKESLKDIETDLKELVAWYFKVWEKYGELPPESVKLNKIELKSFAKKQFGKLLKTLPKEDIKKLYEFWVNIDESQIPKRIRNNYFYRPIFVPKKYRGLRIFYKFLENIKALKEEIEKLQNMQAEETDILKLL